MYASLAWTPLIPKLDWKTIESILNVALRTIIGSPQYVTNENLRTLLWLPTILELILNNSMQIFHKNQASKFNHIQNLGCFVPPFYN